MFNLKTKLEQLIQPVMSCDYQASLSVWISSILASSNELIVVVNNDQIPQGLVTKLDILGLISESLAVDPQQNSQPNHAESINRLAQPITCLPQTTTVDQFLAHIGNKSDHKNYVVVNQQNQLLGLVDLSQLITSYSQVWSKPSQDRSRDQLATKLQSNHQDSYKQQTATLHQNKKNVLNQKILNSQTHNIPVNYDGNINNQEIRYLLCYFLDNIDTPLQIKNNSGETLYVNSSWQQTFDSTVPYVKSSTTETNKLCSLSERPSLKQNNQHNPTQLQVNHCSQASTFFLSPLTSNIATTKESYCSDRSKFNLDPSPINSLFNYQQNLQTNQENLEKWQYYKLPLSVKKNSLFLDNQSTYQLILATKINLLEETPHTYFSKIQSNLQRLQHQFFLNISHDLKSPLTSIVGLSRLLNEEKLGKLNDTQMRYSQMIYHSGKKLVNLINEFLSINQLTNQELAIDTEEIALEQLFRDVYANILQKLPGSKGKDPDRSNNNSSLEISISQSAETIIADRTCLQQILTRLLENLVPSCSQNQHLQVTAGFWSQKWLAIKITGQKTMVSGAKQDLFCQNLSSDRQNFLTSEENKQILGLCLAQQLAKFHGGDISFTAEQDSSSQFTILLPQLSPASPANHLQNRPTIQNQQSSLEDNQNLVIVFDNDMTRILHWQESFAELGYHLIVARNTEDLIYKTSCFQPNYIILDSSYLTPAMSQVIEDVNSNPQTQNISLVYVERNTQSLKPIKEDYLAQIQQQCKHTISVPITSTAIQQIFPTTTDQQASLPQTSLTVMRLAIAEEKEKLQNCILNSVFENPSFCLCHHIIEADSLEQAYLLARIWQIDAIIWDGQTLAQPECYLKSLAKNTLLAKIPIITLDKTSTAIANQIENLAVFPCLLPAHKRSIERLTQVIQIAAGLS